MPRIRLEKLSSEPGEEGYQVVEEVTLSPWGPDAVLAVVGHRLPRVEGWEKVTGHARYTYDVQLPGQLYARVLRSPHPHARIRRIDTSRAEALPGVHAVVSAANTPEIGWYTDSFV